MINSSIRDAKSQLKRQNPTFNVFKKVNSREANLYDKFI